MTCGLWIAALAGLAGAGPAALAKGGSLPDHPVAVAIKKGDCDAAIDLVKKGMAENDAQAAFLGGRMLEEGICVVENRPAAARFFEIAAGEGDQAASLELAAEVGMGEGSDQNYEKAGELCRSAGIDPQAHLSSYALGYACTVRGVAGRILRQTLPPRAFRPNSGDMVVQFEPASSQMRIQSTPKAARNLDATTGSNLGAHRVDAEAEVKRAWKQAMALVPKPDSPRLGSQPIELALDFEMVLEAGRVEGQVGAGGHYLELPPQGSLVHFQGKSGSP
jgi:hypothetical protein